MARQKNGRMRLGGFALVVLLMVPACIESEPVSVGSSSVNEPRECSAEEDSALHVEGEPDWRQYGEYTPWTDVNGCLVRIDVLAERTGPEHCGWEDSRVIITGDPFGVRYTDDSTSIEYVRDPNGVYDSPAFVEGFQILGSLPEAAVDTGYRQGGRELWISSEDTDAVFVRSQDSVERWPRGDVPGCL